MRTFHPKFINFRAVEIINPGLNAIKSDSFCDHVLTALASDMKWCFISHFTTSHTLALNYFEGFVLGQLAFFWGDFAGIVVFAVVEIIGSGCCKCAHINIINNLHI